MIQAEELHLEVPERGVVSALLLRPAEMRSLLVLGHGAGAGMRHWFMEAASEALAARGIATLRYQFPYMEQGRRMPDRAPRLVATVRAAVRLGVERAEGVPILAGGKSMGGRMTSLAVAEGLSGPAGLVFFGFPLHPAGKPGVERAEHLEQVDLPMLFLQGDRDRLADLTLLRPVIGRLGTCATLHVAEGADHSFAVLKRSGRTGEEVLDELADAVGIWAQDTQLSDQG